MPMNGTKITGLGYSLPKHILTNTHLENMVNTNDQWITERTGIKERRIIAKETPGHEMGLEAAIMALNNSKLSAEDLDLIIVSTETPDYLTPSMACIIQKGLGAKNAAAFDINAACSGFVYSLVIASQFISTQTYKNILIVSCETLSRVIDWKDRNTCILFGDGAGAAVVSATDKGWIVDSDLGAKGDLGDNITIPCTYSNIKDNEQRTNCDMMSLKMDGQEVFKFAVKAMVGSVKRILKRQNISKEEIDLVIPHQANIRIIQTASRLSGIPMDKMYITLDKFGNTSSASIPIALYHAYEEGRIKSGNNVILTGFGGGLTWASILLKIQ